MLVAALLSLTASVDAASLEALLKRAGELDTDALVVMHDGQVVAEKWYDGEPRIIESMSVTKSIAALAVGRLLLTGKIASVDEPLHTWFPEWRQGRKRSITLRHLLTQTTGLQADRMTGTEIYGSPDFLQLALCAELSDDPGTRFFYNNKATNLLSGVVERAAGMPLDELLEQEVFAPLGIEGAEWVTDPAGRPSAMSGLRIRPADLAKLGQLLLQGGKWKGKHILDEKFAAAAVRGAERHPYYGFMWWLMREKEAGPVVGYRGDGWQGQHIIVIPAKRLVVVRMREPSEGNTEEENKKYGFSDIMAMSQALVR